jgi:hypothetical protein
MQAAAYVELRMACDQEFEEHIQEVHIGATGIVIDFATGASWQGCCNL